MRAILSRSSGKLQVAVEKWRGHGEEDVDFFVTNKMLLTTTKYFATKTRSHEEQQELFNGSA
jgi:predicted glycosyltransferase involved in capsule biosynthesis